MTEWDYDLTKAPTDPKVRFLGLWLYTSVGPNIVRIIRPVRQPKCLVGDNLHYIENDRSYVTDPDAWAPLPIIKPRP